MIYFQQISVICFDKIVLREPSLQVKQTELDHIETKIKRLEELLMGVVKKC
jgi:hypothetical protein